MRVAAGRVVVALAEQRDTLEEVVEPFLLQQGLMQRTPRGRMLTRRSWQHLNLRPPQADPTQSGLFDVAEDGA